MSLEEGAGNPNESVQSDAGECFWCKNIVDLLNSEQYGKAMEITRNKDWKSTQHDCSKVLTELTSVKESYFLILKYVAEFSEPDDFIIFLIESSPDFSISTVFEAYLELYSIVLNKKSSRNNVLLSWSLASAYSVFSDSVETPENYCKHIFKIWLHFMVGVFNTLMPMSQGMIASCCGCILKVMSADISGNQRYKCVELFMTFLPNPWTILEKVRHGKDEMFHYDLVPDDEISDVSVGILFHTLFTSSHLKYPLVYSNKFKFAGLLPGIVALLNESETELQEMGLTLIGLCFLAKESLKLSDLYPQIKTLLEKLNYLMVYGEVEAMRKSALNCFDFVIDSYNLQGQYNIFLNVRSSVTHAGTQALLISKIKKRFEVCLKTSTLEHSQCFLGRKLMSLLKLYCLLTKGVDTVLVEDSEQILASVNFFWLLLTLQRRETVSLPDLAGIVKLQYLEPLQKVITETLANCKTELSRIERGDCETIDATISVKNTALPELSRDDKLKSLFCVRNATELIKEAVERLTEVVVQ